MANGRTGRTPSKMSLFASGEEIAERKRKERDAFSAKQKKAREKIKAEREARDAKRKEQMEESTARISERKRKASILPKDRPKSALNPRGRSGSSANVAGSAAFAAALAKKKKDKKEDPKAQPKFGVGKEFTIRGGKANVTKEQLKRTGLTQAQYMKQWRATNKRPTASTAKKPTTTSTKTSSTKAKRNILLGKGAKFRPFGGVLARALLGEDEKFGGSRGAIDFLPGKSRPKRKEPVNKMGGGMMKSKMASKGGAKGGRRPTGMKDGGSLEMTMVNGRKVPAFAADGKGANDLAKKAMGGMMKSKMASKGGAKGGRKPGGMRRGGMARDPLARTRRRIKRQGGLDRQAGGRAVDVNIGQGLKKAARTLAGGAGGFQSQAGPQLTGRGRLAGGAGAFQPQAAAAGRGRRPAASPADRMAQQAAAGRGRMAQQAAGGRRGRRPAASPASGPMGAMAGAMSGMGRVMPQQQLTAQFMANGGMMKPKGMAKGGKMGPKGYAKGGPVKKKAVSRKPRGVGAALRGYGKAMK